MSISFDVAGQLFPNLTTMIVQWLSTGVLLFFVHKRVFKIDGNLALTYLIMYSLARIFVESIRVDSVAYIYNIPIAIHISLGIIILSTILFLCRNIRLGKRL